MEYPADQDSFAMMGGHKIQVRDGFAWARFWPVVAILLLAAGLRLVALDRYPAPVNWDELSNMYDGWSIAETGADRAGRKWPILCYGNGPRDSRPALMAWLCAIPSWFAGFTVVGCRGVAAVLGVAGVVLVGVWGRWVLGYRGALLTMLLLAVSPWHLLLSRSAVESTALPGFFCVSIVLLIREAGERLREAKAAYWYWAAAGLVTGFSTNAYTGTRLSALIFATVGAGLALGVGHRSTLRWPARIKILALFVGTVGIGASPPIYVFLTDPEAFLARAGVVRFHAYNWLDAVETFTRNVAANLDPVSLFLSFGLKRDLAVCRLSAGAMPFLYIGLAALLWPRTNWTAVDRTLLLVGVIACLAPSAVTRTNPHSLRSSGCAVLLPMISALGAVQAGKWTLAAWSRLSRNHITPKSQTRWSNTAIALLAVVILAFGGSYVARYLTRLDLQAISCQPEWVDLGKWLRGRMERYDRVYITPVRESSGLGRTCDLYIAAFTGMHPREWQTARREVWGRYTDNCVRLNQFHFRKKSEALEAWHQTDQTECWLVTDFKREETHELGCKQD